MLDQIIIFSKENFINLILFFNIILNLMILCFLFYTRQSMLSKIILFYDSINKITSAMNKLDNYITTLKKEISALKQETVDHKYEIINSLNDLKTETIDEQTSRYKVNEAIRKAMGG